MRLSQMLMMAAAGNQGIEPPEYIGHGGLATTAGSLLTVNPPTCEAGDLLLMFVSEIPTQPSGWSTVIEGGSGFYKVFSKVAGSSESAVVISVSTSGSDYQRGIMIAIRGWSSIDDTANLSTTSTSYTLPEVDVPSPNSLVVYWLFNFQDTDSGQFSAISNGSLINLTRHANLWSTFGDGGGLGIATGVKESVGTSGSGTATVAISAAGYMSAISISP